MKRLCKDCTLSKFVKGNPRYYGSFSPFAQPDRWLCTHPSAIRAGSDILVTGFVKDDDLWQCSTQRESFYAKDCGEEGKFWVAK